MIPTEIIIKERRLSVSYHNNEVCVNHTTVTFDQLFTDDQIQQAQYDSDCYRELLQEAFSYAAECERKRIAHHRRADEIH